MSDTDNKLNILTKALDEILNTLTSGDVLSRYKIYLLDLKCQLLMREVNKFSRESQEETKTEYNRLKLVKIIDFFGAFAGAFVLSFIFKNPIFALIGGGMYHFVGKKNKEALKECKEAASNYEKKAFQLTSRVKNYSDIIKIKYKKLQTALYDKEKGCLDEFQLAQQWIELYLTCHSVEIKDIPLELKSLITQILQEDLGEKSDDLEALLHIAEVKISEENLKRELCIKF